MALYVLEQAYHDGHIRPGDRIAEATSGNTGISFAALGRALGHPVTIFMPDWMSPERMSLIASFGADIVPVSWSQGGLLGSIAQADALAERDPHVFLPHQFSNEAEYPGAHGNHRARDLAATGGRRAGSGRVHCRGRDGRHRDGGRPLLKSYQPSIRIHPLQPAESPTLSTGHKVGQHRIQGISDEFIPPIVQLDALDHIVSVHDGDAILMAQRLAHHGLAVGISSGENSIGALMVQDEMGGEATVATVFCDSNKKYFSTDLLRRRAGAARLPVAGGRGSGIHGAVTHLRVLREIGAAFSGSPRRAAPGFLAAELVLFERVGELDTGFLRQQRLFALGGVPLDAAQQAPALLEGHLQVALLQPARAVDDVDAGR